MGIDTSEQQICPPTLVDVKAAAALCDPVIKTPLLENPEVNSLLSGRLLIKAETAQRTGAFKFRGAYNRIRQMDEAQKKRGVIAYSSGNHAQAVALAAQICGTSALIVMPDDAPLSKIARTRELGGKIITYNRTAEVREEVAERIQAEGNYVMVPPNEDRRVMAGAGTVALELVDQVDALDAVLVPCGGGGLTAATAIVMQALSPKTRIYAVEPEFFDDTRRSLEAGKRLSNPKGQKTICDAIMTDTPGALTFPINQKLLAGVLTVSDDDVRCAMAFAFEHYKIVVEPGAAVGLAAVLSLKIDIRDKAIAVIATGGNVDSEDFCAALNAKAG
ncbi:MAG: threonine/serine dehydratase [Gammaproteobacteria bacterium]|jgi:threonine dehydratase|nr:threonine/serine dehydratase [Gammaproteobacteria bacterium]